DDLQRPGTIEVDEHVATDQRIDSATAPGRRRGCEVVQLEADAGSDRAYDLDVARAVGPSVFLNPGGRQHVDRPGEITSLPGHLEGGAADVGCQDFGLQADVDQRHRERVWLLPGRASGRPDSYA